MAANSLFVDYCFHIQVKPDQRLWATAITQKKNPAEFPAGLLSYCLVFKNTAAQSYR